MITLDKVGDIDDFLSFLPADSRVTKRQKIVLNCLSKYFLEHDSNKLASLSYVEVQTKIKRVNLNKIISELVDFKLLISVDFSLPDKVSIGRCKCYVFCDRSTWVDTIKNLEPIEIKASRLTKGDIVQNTLAPNDLPSNVMENEVSKGMYPAGVPQFEKYLPNRYYKKRTFVKEIQLYGKKVLIELRTSDSALMYDEDLKNVFVLMTLFINQQANSLSYYLEKKIAPQNLQYVEIRHILKALKKNSAGSYYDSFVKSIMRIKRTTFDLHELEASFVDAETDEKFFATKDFSFFQSCWPISSQGGIVKKDIDDNEFVEINPKGFLIKWNDTLFKKMLTDNYFFVLPLSVLSAHTPIFLLYMYLRNLFSRRERQNQTFELEIDQLHAKLNSTSTVSNFKRDLLSAINAWLKQKGESKITEDIRKFDIEGFTMLARLTDGHLSSFSFRVQMKKMLSSLDIETTDRGTALSGNSAAPTALNPMYQYIPMLSNFKSTRGDQFPSDVHTRLLLPKAFKHVKMSHIKKGSLEIKYYDLNWNITCYTDDKTMLSIASAIYPNDDDGIQLGAYAKLCSKRDKLPQLTSGNYELTKDAFEALGFTLLKEIGTYIDNANLYFFLYDNDLLIKLFAEEWNTEAGTYTAKSLKLIADNYTETKPEQTSFTI